MRHLAALAPREDELQVFVWLDGPVRIEIVARRFCKTAVVIGNERGRYALPAAATAECPVWRDFFSGGSDVGASES
jgi:hypothetical protein